MKAFYKIMAVSLVMLSLVGYSLGASEPFLLRMTLAAVVWTIVGISDAD